MTDSLADGPLPDLNLLRTFLAVYRAGSLTAAAPLLGLAQPTVTAQLRALEEQTGRALFTRRPRGVEPTHDAHELARRVAGPLDELAALGGPVGGPPGSAVPVRLAGPAELLATRVLPALAGLVAEGVRLHVAPGLTDPLLEDLRAGRHDLVVATRRPAGRVLDVLPLVEEEHVLVAAPQWAARLAPQIAAEGVATALRGVPLLAYADDLPIARRYWRQVLGRRLSVPAAVTVPDLRAVVAALVAGAGWSVLPRYLCSAELAAGRLVLLHEPAEPSANDVFLVQRPGAQVNADVPRVRDHLRAVALDW